MLCSTTGTERWESEVQKKRKTTMELANTARDPMDSALTSFLDAPEFQRQLALLTTAEPEGGYAERIQPGILKCRPGRRCAFAISLKTGNISHELIAKVYKKERWNVFEIMAGRKCYSTKGRGHRRIKREES
jgi:hypothetical protein